MSTEAKNKVEKTSKAKGKKISKDVLDKMNKAVELNKIVDDFNNSNDPDCTQFIKYNELLNATDKKSHKKNKSNKCKDNDQKNVFSINDIKEMENKAIIDEKERKKKSTWRLITMITLNGIFFFVELVTGISTHSLALQTDAFNMLSDEASVIIGLVVHRYSKKRSTPRMSFGYIRAETIGGLCNSVFMYAVALTIFLDAIELFVDPHEIEHSLIFLIVGILGLIINLIGIIVFNSKDNDNIKGVFIHALGDFLGSVGVLISALIQNFSHSKILKYYIDPVISIIIAIFLAIGTTGLLKKTIKIVAETVPDELDISKIKNNIMVKVPHIEDIHDFHIWQLVDGVNMAVMHVTINSITNRKKVTDDITNYMIANGVYSTTIQIECNDDFCMEYHTKKNHCAFASQYHHKLRIFNSIPVYQHLVGCRHIAILNDSLEDSYEESYDGSNDKKLNQNDNLIADIGTLKSTSCSNLDSNVFDQHEDKEIQGKENVEDAEKIQI